MSFPIFGSSFDSPFLQPLQSAGFSSYFAAPVYRFFELLGLGLLEHTFDPSFPLADHLTDFFSHIDSVLQLMHQIRRLPRSNQPWAQLRAAVIAAIKGRITPQECEMTGMEAGAVPDVCNTQLMEKICESLNICLVWFEHIDGCPSTRHFVTPKDRNWVFFVYMGRDSDSLYCFRLPETSHQHPLSCQYKLAPGFAPLTIGRLVGRGGYSPADEACARLFEVFIESVAGMRNYDIPESTVDCAKEFMRAWDNVSADLNSTHFPAAIQLPAIKSALIAISTQQAHDIDPEITPLPHGLAQCDLMSDGFGEYVTHECGLKFHKQCLKRYITGKIQENGIVTCPRCPRPLSETFILIVIGRDML